tara:strand:- start:594 stop:1190 length:597 start_codon:yes stop_codon:yes gene_type:complete
MTQYKLSPQYRKAVELVNKYNKNPELYNKDQGEAIAQIAYMYDLPFEAKSKGMKKLLYNMGEGLTLGMLPNSWEPREIGEDYGFESLSGKIGGGVGDLLGLVGGVGAGAGLLGAGVKGYKAMGGTKGLYSGAKKAYQGGANVAERAVDLARPASKEAIARMRSALHNNRYYQKIQDPLGYGQYEGNMQRLDNLLAYAS